MRPDNGAPSARLNFQTVVANAVMVAAGDHTVLADDPITPKALLLVALDAVDLHEAARHAEVAEADDAVAVMRRCADQRPSPHTRNSRVVQQDR
jgi:hypothetical protein